MDSESPAQSPADSIDWDPLERDIADACGMEYFRIVRASQMKTPVGSLCPGGLAGPRMADALKEEIGERYVPGWPAVFVNDVYGGSATQLIGHAIHEAAHLFHTGLAGGESDGSERVLIASSNREREEPMEALSRVREFAKHTAASHSAIFYRAALHLASRLQGRGWYVDVGCIAPPEYYGPDIYRLWDMLHQELVRAANDSLWWVVCCPYPPGFEQAAAAESCQIVCAELARIVQANTPQGTAQAELYASQHDGRYVDGGGRRFNADGSAYGGA